jgi:hypothetical protein
VCFACGAEVKTPSGSLWPAARALPRHAIQTSAWAAVSVSSFLFTPLLSSLAMVFGHLAKASEPSSQTELYDAVV